MRHHLRFDRRLETLSGTGFPSTEVSLRPGVNAGESLVDGTEGREEKKKYTPDLTEVRGEAVSIYLFALLKILLPITYTPHWTLISKPNLINRWEPKTIENHKKKPNGKRERVNMVRNWDGMSGIGNRDPLYDYLAKEEEKNSTSKTLWSLCTVIRVM